LSLVLSLNDPIAGVSLLQLVDCFLDFQVAVTLIDKDYIEPIYLLWPLD
tara:strand:+ start:748 stop:894 length:147 start_codon:yes stop_codon:yes gene_type:complete